MSNDNNNNNFTSEPSRGAFKMEKKDQDLEPKKHMLADFESPTSPADSDVKHANGHVITLDEEKGKDISEPVKKDNGNGVQARGNGAKDLQGWSLSKMPQPFCWSFSESSGVEPTLTSLQPFPDSDDVTKMLLEKMDNKSPGGACPSHGQKGIAMGPPHEVLAPNDVISVMDKILDHLDENGPEWSLASGHLRVSEPTRKFHMNTEKSLKIGEVVTSSRINSDGELKRSLGMKLGGQSSVALEPKTFSDGSVIIVDLNSKSHLTTSFNSDGSPNSDESLASHCDVTKTLQDSGDDDTLESNLLDKKQGRRKRGSRRHLEYHLEDLENDVATSEVSGAIYKDVFKKSLEDSISESSFQMTSRSDVASSECSPDSDSGCLLESKKSRQKLSFGGAGTLVYVNKMKTSKSTGMKRRKRGEKNFDDSIEKFLKNKMKNIVLNSQKVIMKIYEIQNSWNSEEIDADYANGPMSPAFAPTSSEEGEDARSPNEELEKLKKYFKAFEEESTINSLGKRQNDESDDDDDDVFYESDEAVLSEALGKIWISEENSDCFESSEVTDESSEVISIKSAREQRATKAHRGLPLLQAIGIYQERQVARIDRSMEPKFIYEDQRLAMEDFEKDQPYGPPCDGYAGGPKPPVFGHMDLASSPVGFDADGGGFGGLEHDSEQH